MTHVVGRPTFPHSVHGTPTHSFPYTQASEIYNAIRIYIAAYVWMTGFGNFSYYYIRKDFTLLRFAQMMWRLNFFVFFVCATMNNECAPDTGSRRAHAGASSGFVCTRLGRFRIAFTGTRLVERRTRRRGTSN